jgi:nucleotide-binding universal stress UspA family protein
MPDSSVSKVTNVAPREGPVRILIPLSGSESDTIALRAAEEMVPRGAELFLLHVRSGPDEERYPALIDGLSGAQRFKRRIESECIFARANAVLASRGLIASGRLTAQGKPEEIILRYADQIGAEFIVLAVRQAPEAACARRVIDHATCAVLIAGPGSAARLSMKR